MSAKARRNSETEKTERDLFSGSRVASACRTILKREVEKKEGREKTEKRGEKRKKDVCG